MGVTGGKAGSIVDQDLIAETVVPAADQHGAAVGGQDRSALGHGDGGAAVAAGLAGDRAHHWQRSVQCAVGQRSIEAGRKTPQFDHGKTAEQVGLEQGRVLGGKQGQVFVFAGIETVFLAHFLGGFVVQGKNEDGLGHRSGSGAVLVFVCVSCVKVAGVGCVRGGGNEWFCRAAVFRCQQNTSDTS